MKAKIDVLPAVPLDAAVELQSGQTTAKKAASILVAKSTGFHLPSARQKQNLLVAFAKKGKVVYGKAFDILRLSEPVDSTTRRRSNPTSTRSPSSKSNRRRKNCPPTSPAISSP